MPFGYFIFTRHRFLLTVFEKNDEESGKYNGLKPHELIGSCSGAASSNLYLYVSFATRLIATHSHANFYRFSLVENYSQYLHCTLDKLHASKTIETERINASNVLMRIENIIMIRV